MTSRAVQGHRGEGPEREATKKHQCWKKTKKILKRGGEGETYCLNGNVQTRVQRRPVKDCYVHLRCKRGNSKGAALLRPVLKKGDKGKLGEKGKKGGASLGGMGISLGGGCALGNPETDKGWFLIKVHYRRKGRRERGGEWEEPPGGSQARTTGTWSPLEKQKYGDKRGPGSTSS